VAAPLDEGNWWLAFVFNHAQLFAPVTCAKAASLMVVPISDSSLTTY
jgi:hypothetical protein